MPLPWVRLDANIAQHDKILDLLSDPSPKRWQAAASYMFALGWSGAAGTDGKITPAALAMVHGSETTARLLVKYGLWDESTRGWHIRNYQERQQLAHVTDALREKQRRAALRTNCLRYHGPHCGCWKRKGDE